MRIHLLGLPHTVTRSDFSHCAFTGKVLRWSKMMKPYLDIGVIHYGTEGSESGADEEVVVMSTEEHLQLLGHPYHQHGTGFYGDDATDGNPVYRQWNYYVRQLLKENVEAGDLIAVPFGHAHDSAVRFLPQVQSKKAGVFELGIGYTDCSMPWRVYESHAVRHVVMAKENRTGVTFDSSRLEWVIPNYYDVDDWKFVEYPEHRDRIVFLGRIGKAKGCDIIPVLARHRPDIEFVICGQGDPSPYLTERNVTYFPPISGNARSSYLGNARAIIAPSRYAEPFCGVVAEAAFCGTPAITSDFGAFVETVDHGATGFRCQTLNEWLDAIDSVVYIDREKVRQRAESLWSFEAVGPQYRRAIDTMSERLSAHSIVTV